MEILKTSITPYKDSFSIFWSWSPDRNDEISRFLIQYKLESSKDWTNVSAASEDRMKVLGGLSPRTVYDVRVLAVLKKG